MAIPDSKQRGYILLLVPVVVIGILMLGYQMVSRSKTAMRIAASDLNYLQTALCAQQCVSLAANRVQTALENSNVLPSGRFDCTCATDAGGPRGCTVDYGASVEKTAIGCYDWYSKSTEVEMAVTCQGDGLAKTKLEEKVDYREVPIFQFAVFYENLLEMYPLVPMILDGRVHSNDSIILYPNSLLSFTDWITTPKVIALRNNGSGAIHFPLMTGGIDPNVIHPDGSLELLHLALPDWENWRKAHRVAYGGHPNGCGAVPRLGLPIRSLADNHSLIEWRDSRDDADMRRVKFAHKATLIYMNGWKDKNLAMVSFSTNPMAPPASPTGWEIVPGSPPRVTFFDDRDTAMLKLLPINMDILQSRSASDSVVYLYDSLTDASQGNKSVGGFLLYNAKRLRRPLTVVTNARFYLLGDYNTDSAYTLSDGSKSPFPSALVSDVFVQLSNDFLPSQHRLGMGLGSPIKGRNPGARCRLNGSIMTGMVKRKGTQALQGGFHNLVRFIEDWTGVPYFKSGSMVCIWYSRNSWGNFHGYTDFLPPDRVFTHGMLYREMRNMPPATPRLTTPGLLDREMVRD
jgi:hypothetical protein